jgi:hypothetical protein
MSTSSAGRDACQPVGTCSMAPLTGAVNATPVHPNAMGERAMAERTPAQPGR